MRRLAWVFVWLVGVPAVFFVLALLVKAGQHGRPGWPYLLPLMVAGVLAGVLCALFALSVTRHGSRPHEKAEDADAAREGREPEHRLQDGPDAGVVGHGQAGEEESARPAGEDIAARKT